MLHRARDTGNPTPVLISCSACWSTCWQPIRPSFAAGIGAEKSVAGGEEAVVIARFLADETGATAIEYCLIACGIAFAIIAVVQGIGPQLGTKFTAVNSSLK